MSPVIKALLLGDVIGQPGCRAVFISLKNIIKKTKADIVIPETSSGLEPFHAVYRRSTCLEPVKSALDAGKWRVDAWFYQIKLLALTSEEMKRYDPHLVSFWNINTPEDLSHAQKMAIEIESQRNNFEDQEDD